MCNGHHFCSLKLFLTLLAFLCLEEPIYAQSALDSRVIEQIEKMESASPHNKDEAAKKLLLIDPDSVSKDVRNRVARAFRSAVLESKHRTSDVAVQGLVRWGGKYSTKILIEALEKSRMSISESILDALVNSNSAEAAEALAGKIGDFFNKDKIEEALKQMGSIAEKPVIVMAEVGDEKQVLSAINILAEIGTEEGEKFLDKVKRKGQPQFHGAAQVALMRIQNRKNNVSSSTAEVEYESDDPFAEPISRHGSDSLKSGQGDLSEVVRVLVDYPEPGSFQADPPANEIQFPRKCKAANLASYSGGISGKYASITFAISKPERVALLTVDPFEKSPAMIQLVDVNRGRALNPVPINADTKIADLSPDGKKVIAAAEKDGSIRIDFYELTPKETTLETSWKIMSSDDMMNGGMQWIRWIDMDRFFVLDSKGNLVVWKINEAKAKLQWSVDRYSVPVLSPGNNQIAACTVDGIAIFDIKSGDTLAWLKNGPKRNATIGFNEDGSKLAAVNNGRVRVWDLQKEKLLRDFHIESLVSVGRSFSPQLGAISFDKANLIVRGERSVDVVSFKERRIIHRYAHGSRDFLGYSDVTFLTASFKRSPALYPNTTNSPEEWDKLDDPDSILAIKPGTGVSIDVRLGGGLDKEAREFLENAIEEAGLIYDSNASTRLVARKESKSESTDYRVIGGNPLTRRKNIETVNVKTNTYKVELFVDGEVAWKYVRTQSGSHFLRAKEGESLQDASNRETTASAGYLQGIELPRYLVHPSKSGPLTTSQLRH